MPAQRLTRSRDFNRRCLRIVMVVFCLFVPFFCAPVFAANSGNDESSDPLELQLPEILVDDSVPPGFESLDQQHTTLVDIYFLGRLVSTGRIAYDDESLQFESTAQLLDGLTGVRGRDLMAKHLRGKLPANRDLVCTQLREKRGCGWLATDTAGVIFDEAHLRVDLFLADEFLTYKSRFNEQYLPQAKPRKTSVLSSNAVATRLNDEDTSLYTTMTGVFSYGQGNLTLNADYNSDTGFHRVRTASMTHYFPDHEVEAGTFTYSPAGYLANLDVMGLRWGSSVKSRRNVASLFGSSLEIFLPRRSIVQVAIGDRVYSGASYEAGNHVLDTSMLPEGTYEVDIRINDTETGDRVEKRLYTRSPLLPPQGQGSYGFMLGAPVATTQADKYPQREQQVVFGADYGRRINGRTAWHLGLMQLRNDTLAQAELLQFNRHFFWTARSLVGESKTYGYGATFTYKSGDLTASLTADHYHSDIDFEATESKALSKLLSSRFTQVGVGLTAKADKTVYGFSSSYRDQTNNAGDKQTNQWAAYVRQPVFQNLGLKGELETRYQRDQVEEQLLFTLKVSFERNQWTTRSDTHLGADSSGESRYSTGLSTTYKSTDPVADSYRKNTIFASSNDDSSSAGLTLEYENRYLNTSATAEWVDKNQGENLQRSVGELGMQIGLDGKGPAAGGMAYTGAGVIVDVTGEPSGAGFDIYANGSRVRSGRIGSRHFVSLKPFKDYSLKLVPKSSLYSGLDRREYEFTLYPGNVERIRTHTVPRYELITTLVDEIGSHIGNMMIDQESGALEIGEDGVVQIQVAPGELVTVKTGPESYCLVIAPDPLNQDVYVSDHPLVCFADLLN